MFSYYKNLLFTYNLNNRVYLLLVFNFLFIPIYTQNKSNVIVGAERLDQYLEIIKEKNIGLVANQTSKIKSDHLVDVLLSEGVNIEKVFSPEHGFRGKSDAGEKVKDEFDLQTGLPILSLYGKSKRKPNKELLKDIEIILFDLQDVGVRFYTYISTLHYVMEACAENNIQLIVLDRPNPNGFYVDGPILDPNFKSFIGMHPVPVVHGLTIGEYAKMINGEKWLSNGLKCSLKVITCLNYDHNKKYKLPVPPSPNLPNMRSVYLYPSLCFFEGTRVSIGRGTDFPFQVYGSPDLKNENFSFKPETKFGAKNPKHKGILCKGSDLRLLNIDSIINFKKLNYSWLIHCYENSINQRDFFNKNNFFNLLAGSDKLMNLIKGGASAEQIRETYQVELNKFKTLRKKYLLYKDFE